MIKLIAARDQNGLVGLQQDNDFTLPWRIKSDLQHFKKQTMDTTIVVGYNTWCSFGKRALPGRNHIIITRSPVERANEIERNPRVSFMTMEEFESYLTGYKAEDEVVSICGGPQIYDHCLQKGWVDQVVLTEVDTRKGLSIPEGAAKQYWGFDFTVAGWKTSGWEDTNFHEDDQFTYTICVLKKPAT